jgi:HD-like signal output (HDOD) protein
MVRDPKTSATAACDVSAVHVRLLRLFASPTYRPPLLPSVALEIMELAERPSVSFEAVVGVLEHDPILAAKVLSISQSALYAPRSPILSLKQAAVRLGLGALRDLVVEAALKLRVFRVPGYDAAMERLSRHSTLVAYLVRELCRRTAIEAEYAFVCGLLHDVGIAACLLALSDDPRGGPIPFEALGSVLREVHESASGLLARLWGLRPEIQSVVGTHHQLEIGGRPHPLNAALIVAEGLAGELDPHQQELESNPEDVYRAACVALGLEGSALAAARAEAAEVAQAVLTDSPRAPVRPGSEEPLRGVESRS